MDKRYEPSEEEIDLFRQSVGPLKQLATNTALPDSSRPAPIPLQSLRQHQRNLQEMLFGDEEEYEIETGEELVFTQPSHRNLLRKLRRGHYSIQARLDLHGMTAPVAKAALTGFLQSCQNAGHRCVLVIHGKGLGSFQKRPVLKGKLNTWLQRRDDVLAFCSARPVDGGTGAVYVLLRAAF
jgi:DNA-nicking Smr family endonuclease